ncbi:hypothetical protein ACFVYP_17010 [Kitasatospora sp. NPDC058201]
MLTKGIVPPPGLQVAAWALAVKARAQAATPTPNAGPTTHQWP